MRLLPYLFITLSVVGIIALMILASSANASIQQDACDAMNVKQCPRELPIVMASQDTMKFLGAAHGNAGRYTYGANTGNVIYLNGDLDLTTCNGKQYQFHEDVHTVQRTRGYQSEDEANLLQDAWYVKCMELFE